MRDYYERAVLALQTLEFYALTHKVTSTAYKERVDEVTKSLRDQAERLEKGYGGEEKEVPYRARAEAAFLKGFADALTNEGRNQREVK